MILQKIVWNQQSVEEPELYYKLKNGIKSESGILLNAGGEADFLTYMNIVFDPSHPDSDENVYVTYPNVNVVTEMTNLIDASRAYEANTTAFEAAKSIAQSGLSIGK